MWVIKSNQIKDFLVTVHYIDVDHNIRGKIVPSLKLDTTRKNSIPVSGDLVQVPEELVKLHKDIYLTADLFFVNSTPLFINLNRNVCFTAVNHLTNR